MTATTGGPSLPQERRVVTAIPGPKSQELQARRSAAVAAGVGSVLPSSPPAPAAASSRTWTATR